MEGGVAAAPGGSTAAVRYTVVGLFEDTIDAEQALVALRKAEHAPDRVSLLVRDKAAEEGGGTDRAGAVARSIMATALDAVGGWLQGLASLIVPERGTFLVAGPIGAALAGISGVEAPAGAAPTGASYAAATELSPGGLLRTLVEFGFSPEEGTYLEHRLAAGAVLVAVTTNDQNALHATRRLFADSQAVYIGMAQTDGGFFREAEALLAAPPEASSGGDVVVTDAVAPLRRIGEEGGPPEVSAICGRVVLDARGEEAGTVGDVLAQVIDPDGPYGPEPERFVVRYVVVGFGGVLGIRRKRVAVPAALADLEAAPVRVQVDKEVIHHAPAYDEDGPFSRREEQAVYAYFGVTPYWLNG